MFFITNGLHLYFYCSQFLPSWRLVLLYIYRVQTLARCMVDGSWARAVSMYDWFGKEDDMT